MKKFFLFLLFFLTAVFSAAALTLTDDTLIPLSVIELSGDEVVETALGTEFADPGCTALEGSEVLGFAAIDYTVTGTVDTNALGEYVITYTTAGETEPVTATRTVRVVDMTAPVITAPAEISVYEGTVSFNFAFSAADNIDGDLTASVVKTDGTDFSRLTVKDSAGNVAEHIVKVTFMKDVTPPVITLSGFSPSFVKQGGTFVEPGYSATDNCDGNVTASVKAYGTVDTSTLGTYNVTYFASDKAGNKTEVVRKVTVYESVQAPAGTNPTGSVIYLTFDDGPGKYTDKLLEILSRYGVKATFFVTNQFPKYQDLIGKTYREGHAIGVHTYSHQWSIYSSKEAYFNDFNAMNEIIKAQTGQYSTIFRFPGGSSNVVSRQYCNGIMTLLTNEMKQSGYIEYDWNIDCADTVYKRANQVANQVKRSLKHDRANIILMHDIKAHTVNAMPAIIEYAIANGYTFATINSDTPPINLKIAN